MDVYKGIALSNKRSNLVGRRQKFWQHVAEILPEGSLTTEEYCCLDKLAAGWHWSDMITIEHYTIYSAMYEEIRGLRSDSATRIDKDVPRTFGIFGKKWWHRIFITDVERREKIASLDRLLNAVAYTHGYCQGMNFVAAMLLSELDEVDAYCIMSWMLEQRYLKIFYSTQASCLVDYMALFNKLLKRNNPSVYAHFRSTGFIPLMYCVEWFSCVFSVGAAASLSTAVFDLFLMGFDDVMIRIGLAILKKLENQLLPMSLEDLQLNFKRLVSSLSLIDVVPYALVVSVAVDKNLMMMMSMNLELMNPDEEMVNTLRIRNFTETTSSSLSSHLSSSSSSDVIHSIKSPGKKKLFDNILKSAGHQWSKTMPSSLLLPSSSSSAKSRRGSDKAVAASSKANQRSSPISALKKTMKASAVHIESDGDADDDDDDDDDDDVIKSFSDHGRDSDNDKMIFGNSYKRAREMHKRLKSRSVNRSDTDSGANERYLGLSSYLASPMSNNRKELTDFGPRIDLGICVTPIASAASSSIFSPPISILNSFTTNLSNLKYFKKEAPISPAQSFSSSSSAAVISSPDKEKIVCQRKLHISSDDEDDNEPMSQVWRPEVVWNWFGSARRAVIDSTYNDDSYLADTEQPESLRSNRHHSSFNTSSLTNNGDGTTDCDARNLSAVGTGRDRQYGRDESQDLLRGDVSVVVTKDLFKDDGDVRKRPSSCPSSPLPQEASSSSSSMMSARSPTILLTMTNKPHNIQTDSPIRHAKYRRPPKSPAIIAASTTQKDDASGVLDESVDVYGTSDWRKECAGGNDDIKRTSTSDASDCSSNQSHQHELSGDVNEQADMKKWMQTYQSPDRQTRSEYLQDALKDDNNNMVNLLKQVRQKRKQNSMQKSRSLYGREQV